MMLTTEQMGTIVKEATLGKPNSVRGNEAKEFRKKIDNQVKEAKREGMVIEIPPEWPDIE